MRISLMSVIVKNQDAALRFYTEVLGFAKKLDLPAGEYRWLTVVSADEPDGPQVSLEPNAHPAAATYQRALYESGIPLAAFEVDDLTSECEQLKERGVVFTTEPTRTGDTVIAVFDDTCGNLIQIFQA